MTYGKDHLAKVAQALADIPGGALCQAAKFIGTAPLVLIAGNGGSAATASHFACDLQKRAGKRALSPTDSAETLTAWANDDAYPNALAQMLAPWTDTRGVLVVLSVSGKSPNLLAAVKCAKRYGWMVIAMVGASAPEQMAEIELRVPSNDYGVVEDIHMAIAHAIVDELVGPIEVTT